jgi:toxin ParE1/3/4
MKNLQAKIAIPNYRLSPLAEEDLYKILSTTIESWGSTQAELYAQSIDAALLKLAQYPTSVEKEMRYVRELKVFPWKSILFFIKSVITVLMLLVFFINAWISQNISNRILVIL